MGLTPDHIDRLKQRGLDPSLAQHLGLTSAPDGTAIAFPYVVRGQVHNTKIRRGKGNMPWAVTGRELVLWNLDSLSAPPAPDEPLIITEGEFDALALLQVGFRRVVSVPNGAPVSPSEGGDKRFAYLYQSGTDDLLPDIAKFGTVILAVDGDAKGQYLRDALAVRIGDEKCLWVSWPEGCKDANDALLAHGPQNLQGMVWAAKRMWTDQVARFSDIPDDDLGPLYTLGQPIMDEPIEAGGIRIPQVGFMVVGGPAGMGKSVWTRQLCWHLWRTYGAPFAITAFEEDAKPTYQRAFRRLSMGKDPSLATIDEIGRADIELESAAVVIRPPLDGGISVEQLLANIEFAVRVYGSRVVLVDPANEVERDSSPEATGDMIKALKHLAKRYRILIIVAAHPPVDVVRKKTAKDLWTHYDIEGGRHWAGKADATFMLWRLGESTMIYNSKLKRWEEMGAARELYQLRHVKETNTLQVVAKGDHLLDQAATDKAVGAKPQPQANGAMKYSAHGGH